ncbi:MAG: DUF3945 domain-containing protein [Alistipes sp.]
MSDENQIQNQAPEQADPKYRETLLLYNEQNGAVEAVSDLKQQGNQYKVTTTQPLTANKPAFYDLRNSGTVAAFIAGFKSQKDTAPLRFLKVAADKASDLAQTLLRLTTNPKDEEGLKALRQHSVSSYQLDKVKFDTADLKLQALQELGIIVSPKELESMKLGQPTTDLHDVNLKIGDLTVTGQYALQPYRDRNGDVQIGLESALPRPEFEQEAYRMMFSSSEKEAMLSRQTPDRLYELTNPHTNEKAWCFAGLNPATNRLVQVPKSEVAAISYFNGVRLDDAQKEVLSTGGKVRIEGCEMKNSDITYSGKMGFDVFSREYKMTDYKFSKPYISPSLDRQFDDRQRAAVMSPAGLDCSQEKERPVLGKNGKPLSCILRVDPATNGVVYDFSNMRRQEQQQKQEQRQEQGQEADFPKQNRGRKR